MCCGSDQIASMSSDVKGDAYEGLLEAAPAHPCACGIRASCTAKASVLFFDKKPASETPRTRKLWIYDLCTNMHFTLKTNPLKRTDLDEFVQCYVPENRHLREPAWSENDPTGCWHVYDYEDPISRDKASLDIFWLKDESLEDSDNLPEPGVIALEIVEDLEAALEQFREIAADLNEDRQWSCEAE